MSWIFIYTPYSWPYLGQNSLKEEKDYQITRWHWTLAPLHVRACGRRKSRRPFVCRPFAGVRFTHRWRFEDISLSLSCKWQWGWHCGRLVQMSEHVACNCLSTVILKVLCRLLVACLGNRWWRLRWGLMRISLHFKVAIFDIARIIIVFILHLSSLTFGPWSRGFSFFGITVTVLEPELCGCRHCRGRISVLGVFCLFCLGGVVGWRTGQAGVRGAVFKFDSRSVKNRGHKSRGGECLRSNRSLGSRCFGRGFRARRRAAFMFGVLRFRDIWNRRFIILSLGRGMTSFSGITYGITLELTYVSKL